MFASKLMVYIDAIVTTFETYIKENILFFQFCAAARLSRFFGISKNTGFFEKTGFSVLPKSKYRKYQKRRETVKSEI